MALGNGLSKLEPFAIQIYWSFHSKFKISLLHHTHHCGIWVPPFPAEFQPQLDSMKSHSESGDAELTQARIMRWVLRGLMRSFFAEVGLRLPLSEKGSCGQRTLIRRLLKPQGSAPEHSHKPATGSVLYKVSVPGRAVVWVLLLLQGSSEKRGQRRKLRRLHCVLWVDVPTGFCLSQSGVKYTVKTISLLQHSSAHACKPK